MSAVVGGFGGHKDVDEDTHKLLTTVKADVEQKLGESFSTYEPHSVKTQVVAGVNYKAKVHVGDSKYIHVTVHQPLPHKNEAPRVLSAEAGKTLEDEL